MGYFRFLLAALVAFSHLHGRYLPLNLGASAVIGFYFVSGYLMSLSYQRFRENSLRPAWDFYLDRLVRLYPSFLLVFCASCLWLWFDPGKTQLRAGSWWYELLIIPYNYSFMLSGARSDIVVPAWSLGAELQFYLLLPLVLRLPAGGRYALLATLAFAQLAVFQLGGTIGNYFPGCGQLSQHFCDQYTTDVIAYRWLPLCMLPFLLGHIAVLAEQDLQASRVYGACLGVYALAYFLQLSEGALRHRHVGEILLGMLLFVPLGRELLRQQHGRAASWLEQYLGRLAYPLFLVHMLARWMTEYWFGQDFGAYFLTCFALAFLLAALVERWQTHIDRFRYRLRGFGKLKL